MEILYDTVTTHQNPLSVPTERGEWGIVSHPLEKYTFSKHTRISCIVHGQFEVVEMPGLPPESSWAHYFKTGYAHEIRVCFENVKFLLLLFSSTFQKKSKSPDFLCFIVFPCVSLCFPVFPCVLLKLL